MNYSKIGTIEGIFLICIGLLNHTILYLPQSFFNICNSGAPLNIIYICIIVLLFLCLFMRWYKHFRGQDILDISKYLGGNTLKFLSGFLFITFFFIMTSIMIRSFAESMYIAYFDHINFRLILLIFFIVIFFAHIFGKNAIIRSNTIASVIMFISLFVLGISIAVNTDPSRIFPVLGNGPYSIFVSGLSNLYAFSGICLLFFISPLLKDSNSLNKITVISFCIMSSILIIIVLILLLGFSFLLHVNELSPIYLLLKAIQLGNFFQNPESLFILAWILSIISFVCVFSMMIILIMQKLFNFKSYSALAGIVTNIIFLLALIPKNFANIIFVSSNVLKYFQIFVVFIYSFSILGLANLKKKAESSKLLKEVKNE